jgi:uncharacterized Fe-S cluster-containing radical SAM superfamily protein
MEKPTIMYDPVILAEETEKMVIKENLRKYYRRGRGEKWYGGVSSAYCCGCNLRCVFCWSGFPRDNPDKIGEFYTPKQVYKELREVALKHGYKQLRMTGNEPTIGRDHLFGILREVDKTDLLFILETNGILIGHDRHYSEQLSDFKNLHVRVSLKATGPQEFSRLTGATQESFSLQIVALKNLLDLGVSFHPAIMMSFTTPEGYEQLRSKLQAIDPSLISNLEEEHVILYPPVVERLKQAGLSAEGI